MRTYRSRKGCFGILVLAGCDAKCMFNFFTCRHPGSTNDAWTISESEGGKILMGDSLPVASRSTIRLPPDYYGVGDDAFVNCETLLTPYGGTLLNMYVYTVPYHLSRMPLPLKFNFNTLQVSRLVQLPFVCYAAVHRESVWVVYA